jgi:phage terminase small subunit
MPLKNPRWERFALFAAQGSTLDEAYREAGYKPHRGNPCKLAHRPDVAARIEEITAGLSAKAAKAAQITVESLVQDSEKVFRRAMETDQLSAANTAIKGKGILTGKWIEKAEVGAPGEYESLSDEELERQLMARLAKLGFARVDALVDFSPSETDAEDAGAPPRVRARGDTQHDEGETQH